MKGTAQVDTAVLADWATLTGLGPRAAGTADITQLEGALGRARQGTAPGAVDPSVVERKHYTSRWAQWDSEEAADAGHTWVLVVTCRSETGTAAEHMRGRIGVPATHAFDLSMVELTKRHVAPADPAATPWYTVASHTRTNAEPEPHASTRPTLLSLIVDQAVRLWDGNVEAARVYLDRPSSLHGGLSPRDAARQSPARASQVLDVLASSVAKIESVKQRARAAEDELRHRASSAAVEEAAHELWGDAEQATAFLATPHPKLDGQAPGELAAQSTDGAAAALRLIRQIQDGAAV